MPCVYIFSNPTIPGLLKIGYTSRSAGDRCRELSAQTGVASPYSVVWFIETTTIESAQDLELRVHSSLNQHRYNRAREFFDCSEAIAKDTVERIAHITGAAASPNLALIAQIREDEQAQQRAAQIEINNRLAEEKAIIDNNISLTRNIALSAAKETLKFIESEEFIRSKKYFILQRHSEFERELLHRSRYIAFKKFTTNENIRTIMDAQGILDFHTQSFHNTSLAEHKKRLSNFIKEEQDKNHKQNIIHPQLSTVLLPEKF
ncbi:hypothetical protein B9Z51_03205 [Limnohabitans sp. T6-5]|uniref:GIY-YIG nuclease family protein n=1 Tax=Limnohabitans sp. T6-5 TaxID=1100724 RepID=UPI000D3B63F7|nr:GIY-YIG nuclease family protein [Limnohabitans sp. T6-5]PUE11329.1 hypothetical protein B9Z51_03205 [Limnohabitans sp. T6-5]